MRHEFKKGDRVSVNGVVYPVNAAFNDLIVVAIGHGRVMHISYSYSLGAWTVGARSVTVTKEAA